MSTRFYIDRVDACMCSNVTAVKREHSRSVWMLLCRDASVQEATIQVWLDLHQLAHSNKTYPHTRRYKYLIVLDGTAAPSSRLFRLLRDSGSLLLWQVGLFVTHLSHQQYATGDINPCPACSDCFAILGRCCSGR